MRGAKTEDVMTLDEQFADPMKGFAELSVESSLEVDNILNSIEHRLTTKQDDWSVKYNALKEAMEYLNGNIDRFENADYAKLAPGIALCITDLRSALVKMSSLLVAASAIVWKSSYVGSIETIVPALFKQLSHGTAVIANSCKLALNAIAQNVQHRRTCRIFLANRKSKNAMHRLAVVEALSIIKGTWPSLLVDSMKSDIDDAISTFSEDANADVRRIAKEAVKIVPHPTTLTPRSKPSTTRHNTPTRRSKTPTQRNRTSKVCTNLDENISQNNSVSERKVSFKHPDDEDISQYMPPQTKDQALAFVRILKQLSQRNNPEPLTGLEEFLPDAIVTSVRFVPAESTVWKPLMSFLFKNYAKEFSNRIRSVVVAFEVVPWIMDLVVKMFEPQTLLEEFGKCRKRDDEDAFLLFTGLFSRCLDVHIDSGLRRFLKDLVKANDDNDDVCLIENALEVSKSKDELLPSLIDHIRLGQSWLSKSQKLVIALSKSGERDMISNTQTFLTNAFADILRNGTAEEIHNVREFLTDVSAELRPISFVGVVPCLIPQLFDEDLAEKEKTEECFLKLMNDEKVLQKLLDMLEEENSQELYHAILNLLTLYVQKCSLNQLSGVIHPFMKCASNFLTSSKIAIRRLATMILVEFKCRAPMDFIPLSRELTSSQQKLISLYSSKRCQ